MGLGLTLRGRRVKGFEMEKKKKQKKRVCNRPKATGGKTGEDRTHKTEQHRSAGIMNNKTEQRG